MLENIQAGPSIVEALILYTCCLERGSLVQCHVYAPSPAKPRVSAHGGLRKLWRMSSSWGESARARHYFGQIFIL